MYKSLIVLLFIVPVLIFSQSEALNKITDAGNGIYFMYYDSSNSKSTVVEFEDFVVLIEAPVKDQGGNATDLRDHSAGGEKILRTLNNHFPAKPLKFFLHSHWHPHSISTINPFLQAGVKVVTTELNYNIIKKFADTAGIKDYKENLVFIADSLEISDNKNKITAYRFTKKDFPNVPTYDYLFFYLPKQNLMHCACMYNKWEGDPVDGKEMLTGREEDLHKFLSMKGIKPEYLIRLSKEKKEVNDMQPIGGLENVILNGIKGSDIMKGFMETDQSKLDEAQDEMLRDIIKKNIPASIINSTVYSLLRKKELKKALSFARLQTLLNPTDPNSWDTYGEVYYFIGETELAAYYEKQSKKVNPEYSTGGMEVWKKDLEEHQKIWDQFQK
ncbi:MAG TPA: hypothetical protein VG961_03865 [Ignavibacteria bacterium]|nr:hypothetical protein [Ignavibacteria bacterium]